LIFILAILLFGIDVELRRRVLSSEGGDHHRSIEMARTEGQINHASANISCPLVSSIKMRLMAFEK
jgi:hypothetical protein